MRLSEWRTRAPHKDAMTLKVLNVVEPVLAALGAEDDPHCWIVWGDDPGVRYVLLAPTDVGLLQALIRVNVPGEGPRVSAKVIRWNRVQLGELGLEMVSGHRLLGFQVESHVLRGSDDEGDAMASFALELFAKVDGRPFTPRAVKRGRGGKAAAAGRAGAAKSGAAKSATVAKPSAAKSAAKPGVATSTAKPAAAKPAAARSAAAKPAAAKPAAAQPATATPAAGKPATSSTARPALTAGRKAPARQSGG
jgi:hypothetical protein